jgi:hypothetical protein
MNDEDDNDKGMMPSSVIVKGWTVTFLPPPTSSSSTADNDNNAPHTNSSMKTSMLLSISISLSDLFVNDVDARMAIIGEVDFDDSNNNSGSTTAAAKERTKATRVAFADYVARCLYAHLPITDVDYGTMTIDIMGHRRQQRRRHRKQSASSSSSNKKTSSSNMMSPFVLERTDCAIINNTTAATAAAATDCNTHPTLTFLLRVTVPNNTLPGEEYDLVRRVMITEVLLPPLLESVRLRCSVNPQCFGHVACVLLQHHLRSMLLSSSSSSSTNTATNANDENGLSNAVAFIANGSILPRKSGRSAAPMTVPPAIPFTAPTNSSQLTAASVTVTIGKFWKRYLNDNGSCKTECNNGNRNDHSSTEDGTTVTIHGMIIPRGVTLIVGGGYHGKSTLLQALSYGVYNKIPFDGRELCVAHVDAVNVRAEDGRYVHNVNVSAFISNLPQLSSSGSSASMNNSNVGQQQVVEDEEVLLQKQKRIQSFTTKDASGSTSQAANIIEALESGASTLLVDEDVSAANFMARDGRMRAMIMDEPITPLLYRVNGLYLCPKHGTSTILVVGGVGEWLDVADAVILMKDYVAYDGLAKARSVSYQFAYGHVQYGGRGVVHRLPWTYELPETIKAERTRRAFDKTTSSSSGQDDNNDVNDSSLDLSTSKLNATLSPLRRRPGHYCVTNKFKNAVIRLVDSGSSRLEIYRDDVDYDNDDMITYLDEQDDDDEDDGMTDMSKCMQLVGGVVGSVSSLEHLYGCGICVLWLIQQSRIHPNEDISELLNQMDSLLDDVGMNGLLVILTSRGTTNEHTNNLAPSSRHVLDLWSTVGYAYRPRRHEVAMTLTRVRGMRFDLLPESVQPEIIIDASSSSSSSSVALEEESEEESKKRALAELWANRRKR